MRTRTYRYQRVSDGLCSRSCLPHSHNRVDWSFRAVVIAAASNDNGPLKNGAKRKRHDEAGRLGFTGRKQSRRPSQQVTNEKDPRLVLDGSTTGIFLDGLT